jgi:hypothetical protein
MPMRESDFCAFILTHGRPDRVHTLKTLRDCGYTGRVYLVVDDEDSTRDEYRQRFGSASVLEFSKADIAQRIDEGDNFGDRRGVVYARNACFDLARSLGCTYFAQLDDDYTGFYYKLDDKGEYLTGNSHHVIRNLDAVLDILLDYYKRIPALSIAMAQTGDFLGGKEGGGCNPRKCMNTFICSTARRFDFPGRLNEDVTAYIAHGRRGGLFLTISNVALQQVQTQANPGGLTEFYLDAGTYVKSFYSVMYEPSCVKISEMVSRHRRIHHSIDWAHAVPMIVPPQFQKATASETRH